MNDIKEDIKILKNKINQWQPYKNIKFSTEIEKEIAKEKQAIENILNELERLQKENNDLRAIKETVRYIEEDGEKDDLYYVVGRGSYLAKVLENAQDFEKTVHTCLHCNENTPLYCEKCYQELISKNAELQLENEELRKEVNEENKRCMLLAIEKQDLIENSIPKQKIRLELEKVTKEIKEVEKKHLKARTIHNQELWRCILIRLDERIKVYEELLK